MFNTIVKYGVIAGVIVAAVMFATFLGFDDMPPMPWGMVIGYAGMLIALSAVFVGIKRHRDLDRGGVIGFWPAFGIGLAISFIAGVFYVVAWEAVLAITDMDFIASYSSAVLEQARAEGASEAALAKLAADMETMKIQYGNPLFRLPMTFVEIFPVGVLVSLVSAALLRNPRFLPARRA